MGTFGTDILGSDEAADVYHIYVGMYNVGEEHEVIQEKMRNMFGAYTQQGKPVIVDNTNYWLALALIEWECKALEPEVKAIVEQIIDDEIDLNNWKELGANEEDLAERQKVLVKFRKKLQKEKKTPLKRKRPKTMLAPYQKGDVIAFKAARYNKDTDEMEETGKWSVAICVDADEGLKEYPKCLFVYVDIDTPEVPTLEEVVNAKIETTYTHLDHYTLFDDDDQLRRNIPPVGDAYVQAGYMDPKSYKEDYENDPLSNYQQVIGSLPVERLFQRDSYAMRMTYEVQEYSWIKQYSHLFPDYENKITVEEFLKKPVGPYTEIIEEMITLSNERPNEGNYSRFQAVAKHFMELEKKDPKGYNEDFPTAYRNYVSRWSCYDPEEEDGLAHMEFENDPRDHFYLVNNYPNQYI